MAPPDTLALPALSEVRAAHERLTGLALRTPLVPLHVEHDAAAIHLKLENLQPIGSFKVRGAGNAIRCCALAELANGVFTISAGNMGQGVAYAARELDVASRVLVPDHAPRTKVAAMESLGAEVIKVPFEEWWAVMLTHRHEQLTGRLIHPVADAEVIAGNGTIGLEILEDLPDVDAIVVPFGGGGLSCGIAAAAKALRPDVKILAAEVETAAPLAASLAADAPQTVDYRASFVDGMGGRSVLEEMWPLVRAAIDASIVVSLEAVAEAVRTLAVRHRLVTEGAGAASLAAALTHRAVELTGRPRPVIACVISGGNIDADRLAAILEGRVPS